MATARTGYLHQVIQLLCLFNSWKMKISPLADMMAMTHRCLGALRHEQDL